MPDTDLALRLQDLERENDRLRRLLDRQGLTSRLRHQVRNTLGMMRAILRHSVNSKATVADFAAHVESRFDALLRVQTALLSSPDDKLDLMSVIGDELLAQAIHEGEQASLDGPSLRVRSRVAESLGLAMHELVSNAIQHGALARSNGTIAISWSLSGDRVTLVWEEAVAGETVAPPQSRGFGLDTIERMLPYQLGASATVVFRPEGLRCTLVFPGNVTHEPASPGSAPA